MTTNSGEYKADLFVLCAGSFSPLLARDIGINIPIRPVKGYSISVPLKGWNKGPRTPILDDGLHIGLTPLGDILRVAGTAEFTGYDDTLDKNRIQNLYDLLEEVYPDFIPYINKDEVKEWCGFRPMSTDGIPFIGKPKIENLNLNTGHGPLGWTMAAGSAKMLCDLISGDKPALNASHYALSRT